MSRFFPKLFVLFSICSGSWAFGNPALAQAENQSKPLSHLRPKSKRLAEGTQPDAEKRNFRKPTKHADFPCTQPAVGKDKR